MTNLFLKDDEFDLITRVIMDIMATYNNKACVLIVEDLKDNENSEYDYVVTVSCNRKQELEILDELKKRARYNKLMSQKSKFSKQRRDKDVSK